MGAEEGWVVELAVSQPVPEGVVVGRRGRGAEPGQKKVAERLLPQAPAAPSSAASPCAASSWAARGGEDLDVEPEIHRSYHHPTAHRSTSLDALLAAVAAEETDERRFVDFTALSDQESHSRCTSPDGKERFDGQGAYI